MAFRQVNSFHGAVAGLQCVIVVFPDHILILFESIFDLGIRVQDHIGELKYLLAYVYC